MMNVTITITATVPLDDLPDPHRLDRDVATPMAHGLLRDMKDHCSAWDIPGVVKASISFTQSMPDL